MELSSGGWPFLKGAGIPGAEPMQTRSHRYGFTLIELLVVISVIAILAAILMPVFVRAKERGRQVTCLHNLKNLWLACRMYCDDNDGRYPQVRAFNTPEGGGEQGVRPQEHNWAGCQSVGGECKPRLGTIWRYIKNEKSFLCPSDRNKEAKQCTSLSPEQRKRYPLSYSMNWTLAWKRTDSLPESRVRYLAIIIHEKRETINDGDWKWDPGNTLDVPDDVHYDGTNLVFADGHAKREAAVTIIASIKKGAGGPYDARPNPPNYN